MSGSVVRGSPKSGKRRSPHRKRRPREEKPNPHPQASTSRIGVSLPVLRSVYGDISDLDWSWRDGMSAKVRDDDEKDEGSA